MELQFEDVVTEAKDIVGRVVRIEKIWSPQPRIGLRCFYRHNPKSTAIHDCSWWSDIEVKTTDDRGMVLEIRMNHNCVYRECDPLGTFHYWCKLDSDQVKALKPWIELHWKICS